MNTHAHIEPKTIYKVEEPQPFENDLDYLQAELSWIDIRCRRISAHKRLALVEDDDEPTPFSVRRNHEENSPKVLLARGERARLREERLRDHIDARLEAHRGSDRNALAIDVLCERCDLDGFHRQILLLSVAPCFSQRFEELYGRITGFDLAEALSVEAAYSFCELSFSERIDRRNDFSSKSALVAQDLVTVDMGIRYQAAKHLLNAEIEVTSRTLSYLLGREGLADEFAEFSSVEIPRATLNQVVLDDESKARICSVVDRHEDYLNRRFEWGLDDIIQYGRGSLMLFYGAPGTGKTMTAHGIAAHLGRRVLNVDIPTFIEHKEADRFLPGLFREARLQNAVLFFDECEVLFRGRAMGNALMVMLLTELERFDGIAIFATNLPEQLDSAFERRVLLRVRFPEPDISARTAIWRAHLPVKLPLAEDVDLEQLASRYELTGGYIKNAVLAAVARSVHDDDDELRMHHLESAARGQITRVSDRTEALKVPDVRLDHVVLPETARTQVDELLLAVRHRATLLGRWKVGGHDPDRRGVAALFEGPPGTGKTLCAEALAGELNRPLHVARTPSLLSKWVGDSERNLEALFRKARSEQAVLLIDEADGLLRGRQDQDSRHDRSLVNLLLDLIERHPGLVLLTTNNAEVLDSALERRLTYRIRFERPGAEERINLWKRYVPDAAHTTDDIDLESLALGFDLSGAEIRSIMLRAGTWALSEDQPLSQAMLSKAALELTQGRKDHRSIGFNRSACP